MRKIFAEIFKYRKIKLFKKKKLINNEKYV